MKCTGCGHEGVDHHECCPRCGAATGAATGAAAGLASVASDDDLLNLRFEPERSPAGGRVSGAARHPATAASRGDRSGDFVEMLDDDAIEVGEEDLDRELADGPGCAADDGGPPFRIDDDLFMMHENDASDTHVSEPGLADGAGQADFWRVEGEELPGPAFAFPREEVGGESGGEPVIDRDDAVPDRYWAPEIAGLGRRALALLVDQSLLAAALGVFFLGALTALRLNGFDEGSLLAPPGLRASALPFALLAALLSLVYYGYFHGSTGRTPGKALAGIEVRNGDGGALTWDRVVLRWFGGALGLACAGVGVLWAIFEPRRRGWADLVSGTVVTRPRREASFDDSGR